jgi:hypothetical protein
MEQMKFYLMQEYCTIFVGEKDLNLTGSLTDPFNAEV